MHLVYELLDRQTERYDDYFNLSFNLIFNLHILSETDLTFASNTNQRSQTEIRVPN